MNLTEFIEQHYKFTGQLPTERQIAEIRSRMEGSNPADLEHYIEFGKNTAGYYNPKTPNKVNINLRYPKYDTLIHELEHQGQYEKQGLQNTEGKYNRDELLSRGMLATDFHNSSLGRDNINVNKNFEINDILYDLSKNKNFKNVFTAANAKENSQEAMANIAEYVSSLPVGVSLKDTPIGQELVRLGIYPLILNSLTSRQITEQENPPTPQPKVNPKASYARQALQYLGFKDPFEDTTKD